MRRNLAIYHSVLEQFCKWLSDERITRVRLLAWWVTGMYLAESVHLSKVARKLPLGAQEPSVVNRLVRWLKNPRVRIQRDYRPVVLGIVQALSRQQVRLILDCTKVGVGHRLLTVSIAYRQRAIPLAWRAYKGRKGHVSRQEQIALLREVAPRLRGAREVWVLGDSGFQTVPLIRWVRSQGWHCVIRLSQLSDVRPAGGRWQPLSAWSLAPGQTITVGWVRLTQKYNYGWLWLVLHWAKGEDEPWYLVSDQPDTCRTLRRYAIRAWTEELYGDLKGHGLDLEATHLRHADRIERLVLVAALVYTWLLTLGSWVVKRGFRAQVDRKRRRDKSYFRIGWDWLERQLAHGWPWHLRFVPYP
ncbi:MAG: transposase [Ardenticatenaceae bacterium]|nr:transposase [Ardenticatenaceae bacterium]